MSQVQQAVVDVAERLTRERIAPRSAQYDAAGANPVESWRDLWREGLLAGAIPRSHGGLGLDMATYAAGPNALATHGGSRRLVHAPFVAGGVIKDWACVLMLHPIDSVQTTVYLEYVGNAASPSSPCTSVGLAGGTNGPLVPVLVQ